MFDVKTERKVLRFGVTALLLLALGHPQPSAQPPPPSPLRLVTGAGEGGGPHVQVLDVPGAALIPGTPGSFYAYNPAFTGGVRVASCDFTNDGIPDIVTGAGPGGGPHVRVLDGTTNAEIAGPFGSFYAYDPLFTGGVFVACGDVTGDGVPEIIAGADSGGAPEVRVFDVTTGAPVPAPIGSFMAYDARFVGGVRVASCDITGDGRAEIVTGAGPGGGPHVRVLNGATGVELPQPLGSFYAYDPAFTGGVYVACGDLTGDLVPDVVTGAGAGGGPLVRTFDGVTGAQITGPLGFFYPYNSAFLGGVRVAACDLTGDGRADLVTAAGPTGGPHVEIFDGATGTVLPGLMGSFYAYNPLFAGGVFVGCPATTDLAPRVTSTTPVSGATAFPADANLSVTFSEPVNVTAGAFILQCPAGTPIALTTATPSPATTFTLDPTSDLPLSTMCTLQIVASQVTDVDTDDPPDRMLADVTVPFTTSSCPAITVSPSVTPVPGGAVTVPYAPVTFTQTGGAGAITWSTTGTLPPGLTLSAAGVLSGTPTQSGTFTFTVTATTATSCSGSLDVTITITSGPNTAPSFVAGPNQTVTEDTAAQSVAGWATMISPGTAPDETGQVLTFNVTNNNAALFSVAPAVSATGTLTYTPAPNANGTATITLALHDNGGTAGGGVDTSAPQTFTITVSAVNDAPSFIAGANQAVLDNAGPRTVATWATGISAGPANETGQTLTFVVTNNTNAAIFSAGPAVSATGDLTFTPAVDANGTATITLVLQDNGGTATGGVDTSAAQTFTITVTPVNDPPTANADTGATDEDTVLNVAAPGVLANDFDPDLVDIKIVSAVNGASANVGTPITLASGALLTVNANGSYVYDPIGVATFQALGQGQTATDTFTYTMQDVGGLMSSAAVTITITGVNDVPALDLDLDDDGGTPPTTGNDFAITFTEGASPQFIEDEVDATISDVDSPNLKSITVTITSVLDALQEKLDVDLVTGGFNTNFTKAFDDTTSPGVAVLTITATTPQPIADVMTLLRRVTYQNLDGNPDTTAPRTITFVVNDGVGNSNIATTTVTVVAVDSPPTADNDSYTAAEGGTLTIVAPGVLDGDVDPEGDAPITAVLVTGPANASSFTLNSDGSFTYTHNGSETTTDSFTYRAVANGLQSAPATVTITITAVNDAPVITAGGTLNFTEGNPATAIDTTILVTDADNTNLASATVQIVGNYVNGQDVLAMPVTAGIGSSFNALSGTLTLTGSATVAAYQAALRTVTYFNNSGNPSTAPRTVAWIVNDGTVSSNTATSTITVTAVNSAPIGGADAWTTFGNTELVVDQAGPATPFVADTTPSTFGVLDNDTDPEGDPRVVSGIVGCADTTAPFVCTTTAGGSVTMETNGRFTYRPQAGDTGADSFQYILTDLPAAGVAASVNVTVNLTVQERIWYVNGTVAGPGTGTSSDPFRALPSTVGDADDFIFVHDSTVSGAITLQNGQKLYGEGFGLSINQALNGNPAPVVLVAPGNNPVVNATTGNAVGVLANTANGSLTNVEIRGLTLATTAASSNAIDVTSANAANLGVTISDVVVSGATAEGIDINQGSSGSATVSMTNVTVTSTGNGIDLNETAGTLTVTSFNGITITGDTGGSGIVVTNATFDATAGGAYNQVAGGATAVGTLANPVGGAGVVLTNVSGDLAFTDLDIFSANGAALLMSGTGPVNAAAGTGTLVSVASNVATLQSIGGPVVGVNNATVVLPLDSASVTSSPTTGITLVNVASGTTTASVSATSGSIANTTGISVNVDGGTVSLDYGGNITKANSFAMVSVSGGHTAGTIALSGTLNATNGTGLQFDNADGMYTFTGTTTLNGGDAGIDILNGSAGTFTFGTGTTITNPTGTAFLLSGSNANVTYSGSISDNTGFAVDISGHAAGTVTFQTGSITSNGNGLQVSNNTGGAVNFNSPTIALTTGANKAVTLDVGNAGGTINFAPGGGGNGLDISTTTGIGFSALGGGTISVSGAGNSITSTGNMAIEIQSTTIGAGGVNFATTTSGGGTRNVKLTSVTGGTIALGGGTLTGATGAAFLVGDGAGGANTGGTSAITYAGNITSAGTARAVDIQDRAASAGNITLSGTITHSSGNANVIFLDGNAAGTIAFSGANSVLNGGTSTAVSLTNNTGTTISFSGGGLDIDATTATGFLATGGGTVNVTGTGNTITTTTGTALNVANTSIGANNLDFRSINAGTAASGPVNGIILDTTGSAGGLKVQGTGSAGSGGTIQRTTGSGMSLNSTANLALSFMNITNSGDAIDENGIRANNLTGTSSFTSLSVTNSFHANVRINNTTGTLNMTVTGSTFNSSTTHDGFDFVADPSGNAGIAGANMTLTMSNSSFNNNFSDGFDGGVFSNTTATLTPAFANMTLTTSSFNNNGANGILVTTAGSGDSKFNIFSNTGLNGNPSLGINVFQNNQSTAIAQLRGKIDGNPITYSTVNGGGQGILVNAQGAGTVTVEVTNNTINYARGANTGVTVQSGDGGPGSTVVKLAGNTVNMAGIDFPLRAINFESGLTVASTRTICLDAGLTTVNLDAAAVTNGVEKLRVRKRLNSVFNIQGITPNPSTTAGQVQGFLSSVTGLAASDIFVSGPATFAINYTNATCSTAAAQ